jgi:hypothetical protein
MFTLSGTLFTASRAELNSQLLLREREREEERKKERKKERKWLGSVRHYTGGEEEIIFPVLKVPRQCPLVLLVEVLHMIPINFYMTMEGLHYSEILTNTGRAILEKF